MTDQGVTQGGERDVDGAGVASGFRYPTEVMLLPCIRTRRLGFFRIESPAPRWVWGVLLVRNCTPVLNYAKQIPCFGKPEPDMKYIIINI